MQVNRARNPKKSPLWQCAHRHYDEFEEVYPEKYQPRYGILRPVIPEVVQKFLGCGDPQRGFARIRCDHCEREYLDFHPHIHALMADGLFIRAAPGPPATPAPAGPPNAAFLPMPEAPLKPLEDLLRAKVIHLLVEEKLLPLQHVQVLHSWKHSGFNLHAGEKVPPKAKADLEDLAQYTLRNPFSVEKTTLESPTDLVIYRSRLNAKINRNFEVFTPIDFLAAITQHIPDKGTQEKILRHRAAGHDPPPRPPSPDGSGPYTCEPCDDVDPTLDYENVLTD
jgi:hypothetical protein